jgi:hypothetical protein
MDADATAEALVSMTEYCCYLQLGWSEGSPEVLVEMLTSIWLGALYPDAG